jgi:hypothetical protein
MFDPRQPRDTGGKWVRLGRGELEQMIDALVQPRAAHIAQINNKDNEAHRKVVARDIKARILKPIKVAPTYHVRVVDAGHGRMKAEIAAKGDQVVVRANVPEKKHHGNVDVTARRHGAPTEDQVVNKAQFGAVSAPHGGGETVAVKARLREAAGTSAPGLTAVAKGVAAKQRAKRLPPKTTAGGKTEQLREVEAALAAKNIKKAQADRLRAMITRYPIGADGEAPHDYWQRVGKRILRGGQYQGKKADLEAVVAMKAHIDPAGGAGGNVRDPNRPLDISGFERLMDQARVPEPWKPKMRQLFVDVQRQPNEDLYDYIKRVRVEKQGEVRGPQLDHLRRMRALAREQRAAPARVPAPGRARRGTAEPDKPQSLPGSDSWLLNGEITNIRALGKRGGVNETKKGTINGKLVFIKPQSGAFGQQIHPGIPNGNDAGRERAAYLVGKELGMDNIAPVVVRDVPGLGKCIVQGGVGNSDAAVVGMPRTPQAQEDKRLGAIYDAVIGNMDRHMGNLRVSTGPNGRVHPIDQGLAFAEGANDRGGWNHNLLQDYWGRSLTGVEIAKLQSLLNNAKLWEQANREGLPDAAVVRARRRISWMVQEGRILDSPRQLGGNPERLGGLA